VSVGQQRSLKHLIVQNSGGFASSILSSDPMATMVCHTREGRPRLMCWSNTAKRAFSVLRRYVRRWACGMCKQKHPDS